MKLFGNFSAASQHEYTYGLLDDNTRQGKFFRTISTTAATHPLTWLCLNICLFVLSIIIIIVSTSQSACSSLGSTAELLRHCSGESPIFDRIDINMITKKMNATLLPSTTDEIFRSEPDPEVDEAWRRISNERPIAISRAEVIAMGKDPKKSVKYPDSFELGESYAARIDVFHQIHCLDALRREAYFEHYYGDKYSDFNSTTKLHKAHLSHCIYYLLQNIMCQANVDVYTHVWTDTLLQPFPDFQINHKCKNFDAILDWQEKNGIDLKEFYKMRKPDDYGTGMEMSSEFKELWKEFEFYNPDADHHEGGHIG